MDIELPLVIVTDDSVNHLSNRDMLSLSLSFNADDERFFDVQGPPLGRGQSIVRLG